MRLAVIGGGGFGSYHARQLGRAVAAGRLAAEILVVDRDRGCPGFEVAGVTPVVAEWGDFLARWLPGSAPDDHLIPAPLAPHLLWDWLAAELAADVETPPRGWGLPYETLGERASLYLSAAGWTCPATCVEPAHCPVLHGPRDWDLADLIETGARERGYEPAVFRCLHLAGGIGSVPCADVLTARERLAAAGPGLRVLVATSSRCHAAVGAMRLTGRGPL